MEISRDADQYDYADCCRFPIAFFDDGDALRLIHGTASNRLDISDPQTGELISGRPNAYQDAAHPESQHYLDYFHADISISPDQKWIADNGWFWHPVGIVTSWSYQRWLHENVWESEDGPTRLNVLECEYYWDRPLTWVDDHILVLGSYGGSDDWLIPAAQLFDVSTGERLSWFAGPEAGMFAFDEHLFCFGSQNASSLYLNGDIVPAAWDINQGKFGLSAWDVATGERVFYDAEFRPLRYHKGARQFLTVNPEDNTIVTGKLTSSSE